MPWFERLSVYKNKISKLASLLVEKGSIRLIAGKLKILLYSPQSFSLLQFMVRLGSGLCYLFYFGIGQQERIEDKPGVMKKRGHEIFLLCESCTSYNFLQWN
jgi:hypothetical protein